VPGVCVVEVWGWAMIDCPACGHSSFWIARDGDDPDAFHVHCDGCDNAIASVLATHLDERLQDTDHHGLDEFGGGR